MFLCFFYRKTGKTNPTGKMLRWSMAFALVDLSAWAAALPSSPFFSIHGYSTVIGGIAVRILAPVIPRLAVLVGVSPTASDPV